MQIGERVLERYTVERRAGAGAMGVVYRGIDAATRRPVAIKVLRDPWGPTIARFRREAEALANLAHPGIVSYLAHGETAAGEAFLVMEWLEGESLEERLARSPLTGEETLAVGRGIADALGAAHAKGIVHRDLKPANVFLVGGSARSVKVVDFGLAQVRASDKTVTAAGAMIGTPAYMSPEQASGMVEIDARTDAFSLGAIVFECLTGRTPFDRPSAMQLLIALTTERAPRVQSVAPDVAPDLAAFVDALLSYEPGARPADARSIAATFARFEHEPAMASFRARRAPPSHRDDRVFTYSTGPTIAPNPPAFSSAAPGLPPPPAIVSHPPPRRVLWPFVALGIVLALTGTAGVVAFAISRPRVVSKTDTKTSFECPSAALACEAFETDDPAHLDGFSVIGRAVDLAKRIRPGAELASATLSGVRDGVLDLDEGSQLTVTTTHRMAVQLKGRHFIVWSGPFDEPKGAMPGCTLGEAYAAAVRAGLPTGPEAAVTVASTNAKGNILVTSLDGAHTKMISLDLATCSAH